MPAREHLTAKEGATPQSRFDLPSCRSVRGVCLRPKLCSSRELLDRGCLDEGRTGGEARERAAQRPADERGPGLRVGGEVVEPRACRGERRCRKEAVRERRLGDDEHVRLGQALVREHPAQVRGHLTAGVLRHPVEDEGERRPAVTCGTEEPPGHRVGVASCGRYKEPAVGSGEELGGQRTVLGED